jgi:hypothetical protein
MSRVNRALEQLRDGSAGREASGGARAIRYDPLRLAQLTALIVVDAGSFGAPPVA